MSSITSGQHGASLGHRLEMTNSGVWTSEPETMFSLPRAHAQQLEVSNGLCVLVRKYKSARGTGKTEIV